MNKYQESGITPESVKTESLETINIVFISSDGSPQVRSFKSTPLGQEMAKEEARIILNSISDSEITEENLDDVINDGSIDINGATLFYVFSEEPMLMDIAKENNILPNLNQDEYVYIDGVKIHPRVFEDEIVGYRVENVPDFIDTLEGWIAEATGNDKELMREDLKYLQDVKDTYIFSSISTNEYIVGSLEPKEFLEMCKEMQEASEACEQEDKEQDVPLFIALKEEDGEKLREAIVDDVLLDDEVPQYISSIKNEELRSSFENFYDDSYRQDAIKFSIERNIINGRGATEVAQMIVKYNVDVFDLEIEEEKRRLLNNKAIELREENQNNHKKRGVNPKENQKSKMV